MSKCETTWSKVPQSGDEWLKDRERIMCLITDCVLDDVLDHLLSIVFFRYDREKDVENLFNPSVNGPLVSPIHKAKILFALELINETTLSDIKLIHKIRNKFAHSINVKFSDVEIVKLCGKLSTSHSQKCTASNAFSLYDNAYKICVKNVFEEGKRSLKKIKNIVYSNPQSIQD